MNSRIAVRLSGVSKRYTIHHEKPTLVERLAKGRDEDFWALNDINLTIRKGERVGIIGPSGSTLDIWRESHYHFIKVQKCLLY